MSEQTNDNKDNIPEAEKTAPSETKPNENLPKVEDIISMFKDCKNFNCDLSSWDISSVKYMDSIFTNCDSLKNKPIWYNK